MCPSGCVRVGWMCGVCKVDGGWRCVCGGAGDPCRVEVREGVGACRVEVCGGVSGGGSKRGGGVGRAQGACLARCHGSGRGGAGGAGVPNVCGHAPFMARRAKVGTLITGWGRSPPGVVGGGGGAASLPTLNIAFIRVFSSSSSAPCFFFHPGWTTAFLSGAAKFYLISR